MSTPSTLRFDPFDSFKFLRALARTTIRRTILILALVLAAVIVVCQLQGTLVQEGEYSYIDDLRLMLGFETDNQSQPNFSLIRDIPTAILIMLLFATVYCVKAQGPSYSGVIPEIQRTGVITWKTVVPTLGAGRPRYARKMLESAIRRTGDPTRPPVDVFMVWLSWKVERAKRHELVALIVAVVCAGAVVYAEFRLHVFLSRAPSAFDDGARLAWSDAAYANWWASLDRPWGAALYLALLAFGLFVIFSQNLVASVAASGIVLLSDLSQFGIDWSNRDGAYGWRSMQTVFRLVYVSMMIRGLTITVLLLATGIRNVEVVAVIATIWLAFLYVYLVVPYRMFKRILNAARDGEVERLSCYYDSLPTPTNHVRWATRRVIIDEIERIRSASINPMGLPRWESSGFAVVVMLPVILTVVQVSAA